MTPPAVRVRRRHGAGVRGFSLIELMVGVAILAVLLALAAPSFAEWMLNTRVRSTAESLQTGLQMARAEAVRRNAIGRFQFTTAVDNSCGLSTTGAYWVINLKKDDTGSPAGACGTAASDTIKPYIIQVSPSGSSVNNVSVSASASAIGFNGLGQQVAVDGITLADQTVNISSTKATCSTVRCLRVLIGTSGQIRMCDPARQVTGDPMNCVQQ